MRVQIVSFHCVVKNKLGQFISSSFNHDVSTTATHPTQTALPGLVNALKSLCVGHKKSISVPAEEAYGLYNLELISQVSRKKFKNGARLGVGDVVMFEASRGLGLKPYRITASSPDELTLDANHPLAGQDLVFEIELTASREESEDEEFLNEIADQRWLC